MGSLMKKRFKWWALFLGMALLATSGVSASPKMEVKTCDIHTNLPRYGFPGIEYDLLEGVTADPAEDNGGKEIRIGVRSVTSTDRDFQWEEGTAKMKTTDQVGIVYTVQYYAYTGIGADKVEVGEKTVTLTVRSNEIGERLNGDYAYISQAFMKEDAATESGYHIRTGTEPWDGDDGAGNDSGEFNNILRTYDMAVYTVAFRSRVRDDSPCAFYRTGMLYYEFILPVDETKAQFETGAMGWLKAKADSVYEVKKAVIDGKECQVLRGSFLCEPSEGNRTSIGESEQELTVAVRALAMKNGDLLKPLFTFWLDGNEVDSRENGIVTGNGHLCPDHKVTESKTITAPGIRISAAPRYNVKIENANEDKCQKTGIFDFNTGNEKAFGRGEGIVKGRLGCFGVVIQIVGKHGQGLRGVEMPSGEDITFSLVMESAYRPASGMDKNKEIPVTDRYRPLVWSLDENRQGNEQQDGRIIPTSEKEADRVPFNRKEYGNTCENSKGETVYYNSCNNGGIWNAVEDSSGLRVTVSQYIVDLNQLPSTYPAGNEFSAHYYDRGKARNYWDIETACISAGEVWVVQPFYYTGQDGEEHYVADEYGEGSFKTYLKDEALSMKGVSGIGLEEVPDNSNQVVTDDDDCGQGMALLKTGSIDQNIVYIKADSNIYNNALTDGCYQNGKDWVLRGSGLTVEDWIAHDGAEGGNTGVAYDNLIKFDDRFFQPKTTGHNIGGGGNGSSLNRKLLYGAKADKTGWDHRNSEGQELRPDEDGYDREMIHAVTDDLIYFTDLNNLEASGYTCVAVLVEFRGLASEQMNHIHTFIRGTCKHTAEDGYVYMISHYARGWNRNNIAEAAAQVNGVNTAGLTDQMYDAYAKKYIPSREGRESGFTYEHGGYPEAFWINGGDGTSERSEQIRNYQKAKYDASGYVSRSEGYKWGDSCLVADYQAKISQHVAQENNGNEKAGFDMDTSDRVVDYRLDLSAVRAAGEYTPGTDDLKTTLYVEVALPETLAYIPNSSHWGGDYVQGKIGQQGSVSHEGGNGRHLEENLDEVVITSKDGITTLRFTLKDAIVKADEVTAFDSLYFSCQIGSPGNDKLDVQNGDELLSRAKIWSTEDCKREFTASNGNLSDKSIIISKNNSISLLQTADRAAVDVEEEMGFTMAVGNNSANPMKVIAVDSFPYKDDAAGSSFHGGCVVKEFTITNYQKLAQRGYSFKLYYTVQESERGKTSSDYSEDDFQMESSVWSVLVTDENGRVQIPSDRFKPVSIAAVGVLPAGMTLDMHAVVLLPDGKPGDYAANVLTRGNLTAVSRSYIVNRTLEGRVWMDSNGNGLQEPEEESVISGVTVTLMKKMEDKGQYETVKSILIGQKCDISNVDNPQNGRNGYYKFTNLPEGIYKVEFSGTGGKEFNLADYKASEADVFNNQYDDLDSDARPVYREESNENAGQWAGDLLKAEIPDIRMPNKKDIGTMIYASRYNDLGIYPEKWEMKKISKSNDGDGHPLAGAVFELKSEVAGAQSYYGKSGKNGMVDWYTDQECGQPLNGEISGGKYELAEIEAPGGYSASTEKWTLVVASNGTLKSMKSGGKELQGKYDRDKKGVVVYDFENALLSELPDAGGTGTYWYMFGGMLLITAAAVLYRKRGRKGLREKM